MKMRQMMERLLAKTDANQAEMKVMQQKIDTNQARMDANLREITEEM
jgi:hypothetical protein